MATDSQETGRQDLVQMATDSQKTGRQDSVQMIFQWRPWSSLPLDILEKILELFWRKSSSSSPSRITPALLRSARGGDRSLRARCTTEQYGSRGSCSPVTCPPRPGPSPAPWRRAVSTTSTCPPSAAASAWDTLWAGW